MATLGEREYSILKLVHQLNQLTSSHVYELVFSGLSQTPRDRALKRLVDVKYLTYLPWRMVGGPNGGSSRRVYVLGYAGHQLVRDGTYRPRVGIDYHALAIVDTFVVFKRLEHEGKLTVVDYRTEPECWLTIGEYNLEPDLYCDVLLASGAHRKIWLEVDLGRPDAKSEGTKQIKDKLRRYWQARKAATVDDIPEWPRILWIAMNDYRRNQLRRIIASTSNEEARKLFHVVTLNELPTLFS